MDEDPSFVHKVFKFIVEEVQARLTDEDEYDDERDFVDTEVLLGEVLVSFFLQQIGLFFDLFLLLQLLILQVFLLFFLLFLHFLFHIFDFFYFLNNLFPQLVSVLGLGR